MISPSQYNITDDQLPGDVSITCMLYSRGQEETCFHILYSPAAFTLPRLFKQAGLSEITVEGRMMPLNYAFFQMAYTNDRPIEMADLSMSNWL
jgi:hypothetical protein